MLTLMLEGGFAMWFILLFGLVALGAAGSFAVRGDARSLGFVKGMTQATLYATLVGIATDIGAVGHHVGEMMAGTFKLPPGNEALTPASATLIGVGESMAPAIVGFALLTITVLFTAIGERRVDLRAA
ncbi:MAG: hypothetical protein U0235_21280 [Polyangiaceae bacterium]